MKQILITCDTEIGELGQDHPDAFAIFVQGKIHNEEVGYRFINRLTAGYGGRVNHFMDVYPSQASISNKIADACLNILQDGHSLGLHTHPSSRYDRQRRYMKQYSLFEQERIIALGKQLIFCWTDKEVTSHRAGGYGINEETFHALKKQGMKIDSSVFRCNPACDCHINECNHPFIHREVFEVPVTVYREEKYILGLNLSRTSYKKLDFRYGSNAFDILDTIENAPDPSVIVLFLHSFNFLQIPYNFKERRFGEITIDRRLIKEYVKILDWISKNPKCEFASIDEIDFSLSYENFCGSISKRMNILTLGINKIKYKILKEKLGWGTV